MLTPTLILLAFGAVMVFSASSTSQILNDGGLADSTYYLKRTLIAIGIGLVLMWVVMRMDLARIRSAVPLMMKLILASLALVLAAGTAINGTGMVHGRADPDATGRVPQGGAGPLRRTPLREPA